MVKSKKKEEIRGQGVRPAPGFPLSSYSFAAVNFSLVWGTILANVKMFSHHKHIVEISSVSVVASTIPQSKQGFPG